jgi:hypothetical protein
VLLRAARATSGWSGAELANLVNEASIGAARAGETVVRASHYEEALAEYKASRRPEPPADLGGAAGEDPSAGIPLEGLLSSLLSGVLQQQPGRGSRAGAGHDAPIDEND